MRGGGGEFDGSYLMTGNELIADDRDRMWI